MSNAYVSMGWNEGRGSHSHYHLILMIRRPSDLVMISLVTSKWQDFKVEMPALLIYCISSFSFRSWIVPHIYVLWPLDFQIQKRIFPQKLSRIGGRKRNPKGVDETHKWHQRTLWHPFLPSSLFDQESVILPKLHFSLQLKFGLHQLNFKLRDHLFKTSALFRGRVVGPLL